MLDTPGTFNNPELRRLMRLCRLEHTFVQGEGVWLTDADGRRYLDAYAQYGAVALGHAAPEVAAAVRSALDARVPAMVQPYLAAQAEALGEALAAVAPGHPRRCVLASSGAEAVEAALKLVRARTGRSLVLAATGAYHGKTLGALSLTGREHAEGFGPLAPGVDHVPFGDADALEARLARAPGPFAALFLEPIQGEGGVIVPPPGYLARARELCSRHGAALVLDEIQTGLGRTGRMFACEHEGVTPDVLLIGKGLGGGLFPLAACLVADGWWDERFALGHSSTFANNNVAAAVGLAVLQALSGDGGVVARAAARGERLGAGLRRLAARYPRVVAEARGRGLMWALQLRPADEAQGLLLGFLQHHGLYAYAAAAVLAEQSSVLALPTLGTANVLRIAPPLVVSDEEIDLIVDGIESMCGKLARNPCETIVRNLGWLRTDELEDTGSGEARAPRPPRTPAPMPPPRAEVRAGHRRWAFLIHYTRPEDVWVTEPGLARLSDAELASYCGHVGELPAGLCLRAAVMRSPATGAEVDGLIIALPLLAEEMMRRGRRAMGPVIAGAVDLAVRLGADVVGLGGFTAPLSERGAGVTGRGVPITTGNALTAAAAFEAVRAEMSARGAAFADARVAVLGARGSVGALMARLAARERPRRLVLIGSPHGDPAPLAALARELSSTGAGTAVLASADATLVGGCDLVLSATGAARPVLDALPIAPGTFVCDVARPHDAGPAVRGRADVTVLDGGLIALPDGAFTVGPGNLQGLPPGIALACLSETILHALDGTRHDFGVGDDVPIEHADRARALARRHGFRIAPPGAAVLGGERARGGGAR